MTGASHPSSEADNFRLRSSSLNVDRCDPPQSGQAPIRDLDGVVRPQNLSAPAIPDAESWDRGSFELTEATTCSLTS